MGRVGLGFRFVDRINLFAGFPLMMVSDIVPFAVNAGISGWWESVTRINHEDERFR